MINFICWKWDHPTYRTKFTSEHVNVFNAMFSRYHTQKHRIICITNDPKNIECETFPIWDDYSKVVNPNGFNLPSCYRRLKIFLGDVTRQMGIENGERVVSVDLDVLLTKNIDCVFNRDEDFVAWKGIGAFQPHVYNGSLFMFYAGQMEYIWREFDIEKSPKATRAARFFGSDQSWLSLRLASEKAPGWGVEHGVFSYSRDIRGRSLPPNARIIFFNGKIKPWDEVAVRQTPWIKNYWR